MYEIDDNERLGTVMCCCTCSPKRVKTGSESKSLSNAGVSTPEENEKSRKFNFEECEINRAPHLVSMIDGSEIKRRAGLRNEK